MATEDDSDVPETGGVFTFGKSQFGDNSPNKFWIRDDRVTEVRCGDEHTAFIAESGRVFTFGINEWGQLGQTHNKICKKPTRIKALKSEKIKHLACGRSHTVLATESGKLYSFGANSEGQLGLGHTKNTASPTHIEGLELQQYKGLAAGADHSVALTDNGEVYVWGSNSDGLLGLGEKAESWQPVKLDIDDKVTHVTCGYYHTALVTEDGDLYTFGETEDGKLGQGEEPEDNKVPTKVRGIEGRVIQVSCGSKHTAVITDAGKLYTFGDGSNGQLGHGTTLLSSHKPSLLGWPKSKKIKNVSCGENHTAIITEKGQLFTFGDGRHGKLALGEENFANQFKPSLVSRFSNFIVQQVSCGGCHTLITVQPRLENGDVLTEEEEEESEDDEFSYKNGELNGTLRSSMDLNGSISARNRRREKLPDPGDTINRTLPPLNSMFSGRQLAPLSATLPSLGSRPLNRGKLPSLRQEAAPFTQSFPPPKKQEESEGEESGVSENSEQDSDTLAIKKETLKVTRSSVPSAKPRPVPRAVDQLKATPVPALRQRQQATTSKVDSEDSGREEDEDSKESEEEKEDKKTKEKKSKKELKKGKKEKSKGGIFGRRKAVESDSEEEEKDEDREDEKKKEKESGSEEEEEEKPRKKETKKKKGEKPKKYKKKGIDKNKIKKDSEEEENSEEESEDNEEKRKSKTKKEAAKKKTMLKEESEEEDEVEEKPTAKKRAAKRVKEESEKEEDYEEEEAENDKKYEDDKVKKKDEEKPPEKKRSKACVIL